MSFLVPLAGLLGIEVEALTERVKRSVILYAVMAVFGVIGVSFMLAAGFFALTQEIGPIYAALVFGGVFLVLALVVFLSMRMGEARRKKIVAEKRRNKDATALITTAALTALPVLLRSPAIRTLGLPAAAIAAYLLVRNGDSDDEA
jgi:cobalamin synthase